MIIFHEGLPRSGKSYESLVKWIIPSLKKGRKVFARINGLNYEKIADLCEIPLERCHELLVHIPEDQVLKVYEHVENDSLLILDELQNFFPSGRQKLSDEMTKFIAEHGHRGMDIVAMGQAMADIHNTWRRRTERKIQFLKLSMLGMENSYKWTAYQGSMTPKGDIQFLKLNTGTEKYDPKYFGAYASHQAETDNKGNLEDSRLNIFSGTAIRYGVPAVVCAAIFAVYHLYSFFQSPQQPDKPQQANTSTANPMPQQNQQSQLQTRTEPQRPKTWDFVQANNEKYNAKLTYLSSYATYIQDFLVIWEDSQGRIMDQLYMNDFKQLGYTFIVKGTGIEAIKGDVKLWFRWMPLTESYGRVPVQTQEDLSASL